MRVKAASFVFALVVAGCVAPSVDVPFCVSDRDCPNGQMCLGDHCAELEGPDAAPDVPAPDVGVLSDTLPDIQSAPDADAAGDGGHAVDGEAFDSVISDAVPPDVGRADVVEVPVSDAAPSDVEHVDVIPVPTLTDEDGDGWYADDPNPVRVDCDDDDPARSPAAAEITCDGVDNDCDGQDACNDADVDGDGIAAPEDCDDANAGTRPGRVDRCGDGIDQDCSGDDRPCDPQDVDQDGSSGPDDCDDEDPTRRPGAPDRCGDGVDQDCDGDDPDCDDDLDGDGYLPPYDCNVRDATVFPGAEEICDQADNNCDGAVDEGNPLQVADGEIHPATCGDQNDACTTGRSVCSRAAQGGAPVVICLLPEGQPEICDGLDNDCDGAIDEDFDLMTDAGNCGRCGQICENAPLGEGRPHCFGGGCVQCRDRADCGAARPHCIAGACAAE